MSSAKQEEADWSARLEYLYVDLGTISGLVRTPVVALSGAPPVVGYRSHVTDNVLRFGVNYRFGDPVVAR